MRIIQALGKKDKEKEKAAAPVAAPAPAPVVKAVAKETPPKVAAPAPMVSPAAAAAANNASPANDPVVAPAPAPAPAVAAQVPAAQVAARPRRTELIPVRQDPPKFSPSLMRDSQRATVKVAFDVTEQGDTANLEVVASTNRRLNTAATDAVTKWKFEPLDDAVRVEIDLVFNNE
jgi:TonB family protein